MFEMVSFHTDTGLKPHLGSANHMRKLVESFFG